MIVVIDKEKYFEIYSDSGKKIAENNEIFWNTDEENPIAVSKERYANGEYVESELDVDVEGEEENAVEEVE